MSRMEEGYRGGAGRLVVRSFVVAVGGCMMNFKGHAIAPRGSDRAINAIAIEPLERRSLFSASLVGSTLTVQGGNSGSTISVAIDPGNPHQLIATVDGAVQHFRKDQTRRIVIIGGTGNDELVIDESNGPVTIPATLKGGGGNDTLAGGSSAALLEGGQGNDRLTAGSGQQTLDGNAGNDTLIGGAGHDLLEGGDGNDQLTAGAGSSQLYGDAGDDTLFGGSGNDTLGGAAEDSLMLDGEPALSTIFTPGYDSIICGSGNDWVVGGEYEQFHQQQTIVAGTGRDTLDARGNDVIIGRKPADVVPDEDEYANPTSKQTHFAVETLAVLNISINVNGQQRQVNIPMGIGNFDFRGTFFTATLPVITSDPGGTLLRMRDLVARPFTLQELFQNWGISFDATHIGRYIVGQGHKLTMTVNGRPVDQFGDYVLQSRSRLLPDGSWLNKRVDRISIVYS